MHASDGSHGANGSNGAASEIVPEGAGASTSINAAGLSIAAGDGVSDWEPALNATPLVPPREPLGARLAALMGRRHMLLVALCAALLWCIVALPPLSPPEEISVGQTASHDILAPYTTMLLDRTETTRRQAEASALVAPEYERNPSALDRARLRLRSLLEAVRSVQRETPPLHLTGKSPRNLSRASSSQAPATLSAAQQAALQHMALERARSRWVRILVQLHGELLPPPLVRALSIVGTSVAASSGSASARAPEFLDRELGTGSVREAAGTSSTWGEERWAIIERAAQEGVRAVYVRAQVRSDVAGDITGAQERIAGAIAQARQKWPLNEEDATAATQLARYEAREPNLVVDEAASRRAREEAADNVRQVFVRVHAGEPLAHAGEVISSERWAQLQDLGLAQPRLDVRTMLAQALLCVFLVGLCAVFVSRMHPRLLSNPTLLWLCAAIPLLFLLFLRYTLRAPHAENVTLPLAATAAMLLTVLADARMGIIAGFVVATVGSVMARSDLALFVCTALLSWTGAMGVSGLSSRGHLLRAGILLAVAGGALHALLGLMRLEAWPVVLSLGAWGMASGVLSILAMAALAMLLERPFGITTHLRLLELLSPDENVLQRMLHEAPGTYTHSMTVAQLSEAAAKAVGDADAMLCRAGGMYHDIGKLRRPFCFIENQTGDNVHDRIAPTLSALVIAAHVRDGLEAGRAMRLPTPILDIIAQHHGTSLISFFYEKARVQNPEIEIDEARFRYPGPKPQGKEAAIVMLADAVEASSRALPDTSPDKLRAHIHAMIQARLREGELSQSDLTLRDLEIIEDAFARALNGALHGRIAYPGKADLERDLRESASSAPRDRRLKPPKPARAPKPPRPSRVQAALQATRAANGCTPHEPAADVAPEATSTYSAPEAAHSTTNGSNTNGSNTNGASNGTPAHSDRRDARGRGAGRRR